MKGKWNMGKKMRQTALCVALALLMAVSVVTNISNIARADGGVSEQVQVADDITNVNVTGTTQNVLYNCDDSAVAPAGSSKLEGNEFDLDPLDNEALASWVNDLKLAYYGDDVNYYESIKDLVTVPTGNKIEATKLSNKLPTGEEGTVRATGNDSVWEAESGTYYYIRSYDYYRNGNVGYVAVDDSGNACISEDRFIWKIVEHTAEASVEEGLIKQYILIPETDENMALTVGARNTQATVTAITADEGVYSPSDAQLIIFGDNGEQSLNGVTTEILKMTGTGHMFANTLRVSNGLLMNSGISGGHVDHMYLETVVIPEMDFPEISYTWKSSNPEIAEISDTGWVRVYSEGEVTFTCTAYAGAGLTVKVSDTIPMTYSSSVTYNFDEYEINDGKPLTDTSLTENFPAAGQPGSVMIEKDTTDVSAYDETGVARLQLDLTSIAGEQPIDVVLVIDVSRSMVDFWRHDVVYTKSDVATVVDNDSSEETYAYYNYYIPAGYLDKSQNPIKPYDEEPEPIYTWDGNIAYYSVYEFDTNTYTLYEPSAVSGAEVISGSDFVSQASTIEGIAPDGYKGVTHTAEDEQLLNYNKLNAARESAATFVNTLLTSSPESRVALVQFANDDKKDDGSYYSINSRVVSGFTGNREELIDLIYNKADADDNVYAREGAGGGYYEYDTTGDAVEADMTDAGMTLSNLGGTNYGIAFERAEEAIAADTQEWDGRRRIVIFMTDGEPNTVNLANSREDSVFGNVDEGNYVSYMLNSDRSKNTASWSYFALRRQLQAKLRLEEQGFEIISVGFDLDSDGTGYLGVYTEDDTYSVDGKQFDVNLADEFNHTGSDKDLLGLVRKKIVENVATFDSNHYSVEKSGEDGNPDYSALNAEYEKIAESIIRATENAVVTDIIGDNYELRLLPYNKNGTETKSEIIITVNDVYSEGDGTWGEYLSDADIIETVTFSGSSLADGIKVTHTYIDESGKLTENEEIMTVTTEDYVINGHYFTYDSETKTFVWNVGDVPGKHYSFAYDVYLTGSDPAYEQAMGRTDSSWQNDGEDTEFAVSASDMVTNENAEVAYTNYIGNDCLLTYEKPDLDWQTTSVSVGKEWSDSNNAKGARPSEVEIQLVAEVQGVKSEVYAPITLDAGNNWEYTWEELPMYSDGCEITYTVTEKPVEFYTPEYSSDKNSWTVTNKLAAYKVTVKYEDLSGNTLAPDNIPYSTLLPENEYYNVIDEGCRYPSVSKDDVNYTFYKVKENSGDESGNITGDVTVTYVYVECKKPSVVKAVDTSTVYISETPDKKNYYINYTITVTNNSDYPLINAEGTDTLPEGLEFVSSEGNVTAASDKRTLAWSIDSIDAKGNAQISVRAKITDISVALPYENTAYITAADFVPEENGTPIEQDYSGNPIESNKVSTDIVRQYDVTVKYVDTEGNTIHSDDKPYSTLLNEGTHYDVVEEGSKLSHITNNGVTYTFLEIIDRADDSSDDEEGNISSDVTVTYVYARCKAPTIDKEVDYRQIYISAPVSETDYIITYTITVTNPNSFEMLNVQCSDLLPEGLEFVQAGSDSRVSAGADRRTLSWKIDSIAGSDDEIITVRAKITETAKAPYDNFAVVSAASFNPDNDDKITTVEYRDNPDTPADESVKSKVVRTDVYMTPEITKAVDKHLAAVGQEITYTVRVKNTSSAPLYNLTVSDTIPEGMEFVPNSEVNISVLYNAGKPEGAAGDTDAAVSGRELTVYIPALGRYDTAEITMKVTITDGSKLVYRNTAYIESGYLEPVPEGTEPPASDVPETPSNEVETKIDADPYITKSVDKSAARVGDTLTYTLTVTNNTADTLYDVKVTDAVPEGLEEISVTGGTYDAASGTVTWIIPTVTPGDTAVTFTAKAASETVRTYTNTGVLVDGYTDTDGDGTREHHEYNKDDDAETKIIEDPEIHKEVDKSLTFVGDTIRYTVEVSNPNTDFDLHNILVTDTLPEGLEFVSATDGVSHAAGVLSCNISELAVGDKTEFRVTARIKDGAKAVYYNTAYITEATADTDRDGDADGDDRKLEYPGGINRSETVETDVHYDLVIEYRAESSDGTKLKPDYTLVDQRRGTEYDVNSQIPDTIVDENKVVWVKREITSDSSAREGVFDSDKKIVVIYERYDSLYSLKKYVSADNGASWQDDEVTVAPGTKVLYKIVIENLCGHEVKNLTLGDILNMNGNKVDEPDVSAFADECGTTLPVEGWQSAPIEYTIPDTATGGNVFVNTATVSNSDADIPAITDDATVKIDRDDHLSITKTAQLEADENGNKIAAKGQQVAFVLLVENKGNTVLGNILVIDDTYDVIIKDSEGDHLIAAGNVIRTIPVLYPGQSESITVYFEVPETAEDGAKYDNYATAKIIDKSGNDVLRDEDNDVIVVENVEAKLSIIKTVNGTDKVEAKPGDKVYFDITVVNTGNADAENVYITDKMLVNGEDTDAEWALGGEWTVSVSASDSTVVASGIEWTVPAGTPSDTDFTNVVLLYSSKKDAEDGKNPVSEDRADVVTEASYELEITKEANVDVAAPGDKLTYAIAVTNKSNAAIENISVTDLQPGQWGTLPVKTESGRDVEVTVDEDNILNISRLEQGDVLWLTFIYDVPSDYDEDVVANTVRAEADTPDGETEDEATEHTKIHINALEVTKEAHCEEIYAGEKILYVITVTNTGEEVLENVVVTEKLDVSVQKEYVKDAEGELSETDLSADSISATDISATDLVIGFIETLEPEESRVFYVEYEVPKDAKVGDKIWNTASAVADGGHEDSASDEVEVIEYVERDYSLAISKTTTAKIVKPGDNITYLITVTNKGKDDLTEVVVTDSLDVVYGGASCKAGSALATFDLLRSGESKILNVSYVVPEGYKGKSLVNTAYADSKETDKVESSASVDLRNPEIELTKTVNSKNVTAGERVYYKLIVTNTGNCNLTDVVVQDTSVGYKVTIPSLAPGDTWESADGALSYLFSGDSTVGTSFTNNATVFNAEVKGVASTVSTVKTPSPGYTAPNTGDTSDKTDSAVAAIAAVSLVMMLALGAVIIYRRRKTKAQ